MSNFFESLGNYVSGMLEGLPVSRMPQTISSFGESSGSGNYYYISNGFGGPVGLNPGDQWSYSFGSITEGYWEFGLNLADPDITTTTANPNFASLQSAVKINDEVVVSGDTTLSGTVFVDTDSTGELLIISPSYYLSVIPTGYAFYNLG